jgi:hypothetical protein
MHRVIGEQGRWNPGPDKHGRRAGLPDELLPKIEGIKRPHSHRKASGYLFDPLERWLRSKVGRPWNDVYSEVCAVIKPDSLIRTQVKKHFLQLVERDAFMCDGEVFVLGPCRSTVPIASLRNGFYVHPETGLLHEIVRVALRERRQVRLANVHLNFHWLDDLIGFRRFGGIWFSCRFEIVPSTGRFMAYDYIAGKYVGRGGLVRRKGNYLHCIAKRQLSRQELRRHGLANSGGDFTPGVNPSERRSCGVLRDSFQFLRAVECGLSWTRQWRFESVPWSNPRWCK